MWQWVEIIEPPMKKKRIRTYYPIQKIRKNLTLNAWAQHGVFSMGQPPNMNFAYFWFLDLKPSIKHLPNSEI